MMCYKDIERTEAQRGVVQLRINRPEARNALRTQTLAEIADVLVKLENDDEVGCVVITGGKNFAAGADVREMAQLDTVGLLKDKRVEHWHTIRQFPKPLIAAVNGFCLGGGCELAMHCDLIIAGTDSRFGQPEINLAIIPGAGGTQRLIRCVGQSLAAKMILTGETIDAPKALSSGLVAELCQPELTLERAIQLAETIASKAPLAVRMAKQALQQAFESPLSAGLQFERRSFVALAATEDRNEGIAAFLERRKPIYKGQ